jgi:hypothetical protein
MFGKDGSQKASIFNTSLGLSDYKNYSKANFSMLYEEKNLYEEYCTTH